MCVCVCVCVCVQGSVNIIFTIFLKNSFIYVNPAWFKFDLLPKLFFEAIQHARK